MKERVTYPAIEERRAGMRIAKQAVADRLGLSWESASMKLSGEREFSLSEAQELADWWSLSIDDLIGRKVPDCPIYHLPERGSN